MTLVDDARDDLEDVRDSDDIVQIHMDASWWYVVEVIVLVGGRAVCRAGGVAKIDRRRIRRSAAK